MIGAFVALFAWVALATAPATAEITLQGVDVVSYEWEAEDWPSFLVWVSFDDGTYALLTATDEPRVSIPVSVGQSLVIRVGGVVGTWPGGQPRVGPWSLPSEKVRIEPEESSGGWILDCDCGVVALQDRDDPDKYRELPVGSSFGAWADLGEAGPAIVWYSEATKLVLLTDLGGLQIAPELQNISYAHPDVLDAADLDGDGVAEIVIGLPGKLEIHRFSEGQLVYHGSLNRRTGTLAPLADYDGDGRADFLWFVSTSGFAYFSSSLDLNFDTLQASYGNSFGVSLTPVRRDQLADSADFDGDGWTDLLFRATDGAFTIAYLQGGFPDAYSALPRSPGDEDLELATSLDFDGSPGAELALQDGLTGELVVVAPEEVPEAGTLALDPGTDWRVVDSLLPSQLPEFESSEGAEPGGAEAGANLGAELLNLPEPSGPGALVLGAWLVVALARRRSRALAAS